MRTIDRYGLPHEERVYFRMLVRRAIRSRPKPKPSTDNLFASLRFSDTGIIWQELRAKLGLEELEAA